MTTQTRTNTPDEPHEPAVVLEEIPAIALDARQVPGRSLSSTARRATPSSWLGNGSWWRTMPTRWA